MKVVIITMPRGKKKTQAICVRFVSSLSLAYDAYPATRTYEKIEFTDRIQLISPAANRFYNTRNIFDRLKTIYLKPL